MVQGGDSGVLMEGQTERAQDTSVVSREREGAQKHMRENGGVTSGFEKSDGMGHKGCGIGDKVIRIEGDRLGPIIIREGAKPSSEVQQPDGSRIQQPTNAGKPPDPCAVGQAMDITEVEEVFLGKQDMAQVQPEMCVDAHDNGLQD